jgi:hypothetical protein
VLNGISVRNSADFTVSFGSSFKKSQSSRQHCIRARAYIDHPGFVSLGGNGGAFACRLVDLAIRVHGNFDDFVRTFHYGYSNQFFCFIHMSFFRKLAPCSYDRSDYQTISSSWIWKNIS